MQAAEVDKGSGSGRGKGTPARQFPGSGTDIAAGLFLLVCGLLGSWLGQDLKVGTAYRMGPGYAPMLLSWILGGFGLVLAILGVLRAGTPLERWNLRRLVLVLGAMVVFGLTVERLGLFIASLLAVAIAAMAGDRARMREIGLLACCMAGFACLLFAFALQLPLRVLP